MIIKIILISAGLLTGINQQILWGQVLEIHQINVGQGDATMIVIRDTAALRASFVAKGVPLPAHPYQWLQVAIDSSVILTGTVKKSFLIDAGEASKTAAAIFNYMNTIGVGKDQIRFFILSHFHRDHNAGFYDLMDKYKVFPDSLLIRQERYKTRDKLTSKAIKALKKSTKDTLTNRTIQVTANQTDLLLGRAGTQAIRLTSIGGAMATAFQPADIPRNTNSKNDENNYSLLWALQLGAFRYYTGGDLNGYTDTGPDPEKIDLESPLVDSLLVHDPAQLKDTLGNPLNKGHFCSLKLNHHGGEESSNPYFLAVMKPSSAMISCGQQNHKHPRKRVIEDLDATMKPQWDISSDSIKPFISVYHSPVMVNKTIQNYFVTNLHDLNPKIFYKKIGDPAQSKGIIAGNIVTVVDSSNPLKSAYYVFWDGKKGTTVVSKPNKLYEPNAKGGKYINCHQSDNPPPFLTSH